MDMQVSQAAVEFVAYWEGEHLQLYNDPSGNATIGYGHLVHKGPVNGTEEAKWRRGLTKEEALALLREDMRNAEQIVRDNVTAPLSQHQFDCLVSFAFNVGRGNFQKSDLLSRLNNGEYGAIPYELSRWTRSGGQRFAGLVRRREQESELWSNADYNPTSSKTLSDTKEKAKEEVALANTPSRTQPITTSIPWLSQLDIYTDSNSYSYDCLAACVAMILRWFAVIYSATGKLITIDDVVSIWGKPKATDAGYHILAPVNESPAWFPVTFYHRREVSWAQVAAETAQNRPVVAYIQADLLPPNWRYHGYRGDHFVLITGVANGQVRYLDPNWETEAQGRCWLPLTSFEPAWRANAFQALFMKVK